MQQGKTLTQEIDDLKSISDRKFWLSTLKSIPLGIFIGFIFIYLGMEERLSLSLMVVMVGLLQLFFLKEILRNFDNDIKQIFNRKFKND